MQISSCQVNSNKKMFNGSAAITAQNNLQLELIQSFCEKLYTKFIDVHYHDHLTDYKSERNNSPSRV